MSRIQPSSPETSRRMAKVRQKGTDAEIALRRELYRRGLRYRIDYEVLKKPRRVADVAFPGLSRRLRRRVLLARVPRACHLAEAERRVLAAEDRDV